MAVRLGNKRLLAIDWDKKDLRLALVRTKREGIELLKAVSVSIPPEVVVDDAESLGSFLREAIRQSNMSVKSALMTVPREHVVLNTLNLPPTPEDEMPALVQFQVVKELPFAAEQAVIDFAVSGGHDPKAPCTALVAAVRSDDLDFFRRLGREAGLTVERVGLRPYANVRAVLANLEDQRDKSLLVVEVGPFLTEIDVFRAGALTFSRAASAPLPELKPTTAEQIKDSRISTLPVQNLEADDATREAVGRLMVEIIRSFEAYRATDAAVSIDRIVVCGATGVEAELAQALAARFAARTELFSPERSLGLAGQRARELRGFSAPIGLAMAHDRPRLETFDFLHPKKPVSRRAKRMKKAPVAALTAVLLIAAVVTAHVRVVKPEQARVAALDAELDELLRPRKRPIERFSEQLTALEDWMDAERRWPEELVALTRSFPLAESAYIKSLDFDTKFERKGKSINYSCTMAINLRTAALGVSDELRKALEDPFDHVGSGDDKPSNANDSYRNDARIWATIPRRPAAPPDSEAGELDASAGDAVSEVAEEQVEPGPSAERRPAEPASDSARTAEPVARRASETKPAGPATPPAVNKPARPKGGRP